MHRPDQPVKPFRINTIANVDFFVLIAQYSSMTHKFDRIAEGALPPDQYRAKVLADGPSKGKKALLRSHRKSMNHFVPDDERRKVKEQTIQKEIAHYLRGRGFWVHKAKAQNARRNKNTQELEHIPTEVGIPDLLCISPSGLFFAIEVKSARYNVKASAEQLLVIEQLRSRGVHAFVSHSVPHVRAYLAASNDLKTQPMLTVFPIIQTKDMFVPCEKKWPSKPKF